ncbi:MAG: hypothetical protein KGL35_12625 [Bradyrhizobium sp.]|nr:hypothetical protein [Bradyrhizobium sp.]
MERARRVISWVEGCAADTALLATQSATEFARVRREALEQAAQLCDEYADENMRICQDNIVLDPVLHGDLSEAAMIRGNEMIIDSRVHSSMYHVANNIAAAIRNLMEEPKQ